MGGGHMGLPAVLCAAPARGVGGRSAQWGALAGWCPLPLRSTAPAHRHPLALQPQPLGPPEGLGPVRAGWGSAHLAAGEPAPPGPSGGQPRAQAPGQHPGPCWGVLSSEGGQSGCSHPPGLPSAPCPVTLSPPQPSCVPHRVPCPALPVGPEAPGLVGLSMPTGPRAALLGERLVPFPWEDAELGTGPGRGAEAAGADAGP